MAPSRVTDSDILAIWKRTNGKRLRFRAVFTKLRAGQHVRVSKQKIMFAKGGEQNFNTKIFRIVKIIERRNRPLFELKDLNRTPINAQFYQEEMTPVRFTRSTVYKILKILDE